MDRTRTKHSHVNFSSNESKQLQQVEQHKGSRNMDSSARTPGFNRATSSLNPKRTANTGDLNSYSSKQESLHRGIGPSHTQFAARVGIDTDSIGQHQKSADLFQPDYYPKPNGTYHYGNTAPYHSQQPRSSIYHPSISDSPSQPRMLSRQHQSSVSSQSQQAKTPYYGNSSNVRTQFRNDAQCSPQNCFNNMSTFSQPLYNYQNTHNYQPANNAVFLPANNPPQYGSTSIGTGFLPPFQTAVNPLAIPPYFAPPPVTPLNVTEQSVVQEELDKTWVNKWLEKRQIKKTITVPRTSDLKISEAQKLMQKCLALNEELKIACDELGNNLDMTEEQWSNCVAKIDNIKEELLSNQNVLSDPKVIENLKSKIWKRQKKRLWCKSRMKRRHLEKIDDIERREKLHKEIDEWREKKIAEDLASRKESMLKREAGGVLGEVRRKQTDGRKLLELLKSIKKLREIRKSEGEKKGVYPKTSLESDHTFLDECKYLERFMTKRIESYEDEEKALRVMLVEEEEEREKKEEQERLEQKALLNLSKDPDPLSSFQQFYSQAEKGLAYLIQIRREWDAYAAPEHVFGASQIPCGEVEPSPPSYDVWSSALSNNDAKNDDMTE